MKKRPLQDHKKIKKNFVTPFNDSFNLEPVSYENETIPQIVWLAIILEDLGDRIGSEFINEMAKSVKIDSDSKIEMHTMLFLSNYELLTLNEKSQTLENWSKNGILTQLQISLSQFTSLYPMSPISFIGSKESSKDLNEYKSILNKLLNRLSRLTTMSLASIIYNQFDIGRLKVNADMPLAKFPEVQHYPNTEISKRVASSIRASVKTYHKIGLLNQDSEWSKQFWNQSYKLQPWKM